MSPTPAPTPGSALPPGITCANTTQVCCCHLLYIFPAAKLWEQYERHYTIHTPEWSRGPQKPQGRRCPSFQRIITSVLFLSTLSWFVLMSSGSQWLAQC